MFSDSAFVARGAAALLVIGALWSVDATVALAQNVPGVAAQNPAVAGKVAAADSESVSAQPRPSCPDVIDEVNRLVTAHHGQPAGVQEVAHRLNTQIVWVQRCMRAYGRIPAKRIVRTDEDVDSLDQAVEEGNSQVEVRDENGEQIPTSREEKANNEDTVRKGMDTDAEDSFPLDIGVPGKND